MDFKFKPIRVAALLFSIVLAITTYIKDSYSQENAANLLQELKNTSWDMGKLRMLGDNVWFRLYDDNPILAPGKCDEWDGGAIGSVMVVRGGDVFHMYYEAWAANPEGAGLDFTSLQIGHAVSLDGVHWKKDPQNPVLPKGAAGAWDIDGTWDPYVIYEDGTFRMWYGGGKDKHCDWGYAESQDGTHFEKHGRISQLGQVSDEHVVHDAEADKYYMYYWDKRFEPHQAVFRAESSDPTNFEFAHALPVPIVGEPADAMFKFTQVLRKGDKWYMFYANFVRPQCVDSTTRLATSDDGIHWASVNKNLFTGHDAEIVSVDDTLHLAYFSPRGFYNEPGCDVRLAVYTGKLSDLVQTTE